MYVVVLGFKDGPGRPYRAKFGGWTDFLYEAQTYSTATDAELAVTLIKEQGGSDCFAMKVEES